MKIRNGLVRLLAAMLLVSTFASAVERSPEETSKEPGPSWDPRPGWQRAQSGHWKAIFRRRPVQEQTASEVVPVAGNIPFRIPRALTAVPVEVAPAVQPLAEGAPGRLKAGSCAKPRGRFGRQGTPAEDKQFAVEMEKVMDVIRRNPMFPPAGFEIQMSCTYEKRDDASGVYQGRILMLFYPDTNKRHYWEGGLEILVNDLGVMGPRNNSEDRATDPALVFPLPFPATYRGLPYLGPEHGVWGGIYLTKRPESVYKPVTYREWLAENLTKLEAEYQERKAVAEQSPTVRNQFVRRNMEAAYERALITSQRMPADELDAPLWLTPHGPADAAHLDASRQVRLNLDGFFDRNLPRTAIQLINIVPVYSKYNHLHAVLEQMDYAGFQALLR